MTLAHPHYCPCRDEKPDPCPACGATVAGHDSVRGICQAWGGCPPNDYGLQIELQYDAARAKLEEL